MLNDKKFDAMWTNDKRYFVPDIELNLIAKVNNFLLNDSINWSGTILLLWFIFLWIRIWNAVSIQIANMKFHLFSWPIEKHSHKMEQPKIVDPHFDPNFNVIYSIHTAVSKRFISIMANFDIYSQIAIVLFPQFCCIVLYMFCSHDALHTVVGMKFIRKLYLFGF